MQYIIYLCHAFKPLEIDICRDTFISLRGTVYKEFVQLLRKYEVKFEHNKSENIITINGNAIHFYGLDNDEKIHGKERDIIWINEINQIKKEVFDQIAPRTRHRIIGDYNPRLGRRHWLDEFIDKYPPLITTYKDNPFLTKIQIADIESKKSDPYWWSIYGDGRRAAMEGAIFENWDFGEFDETLPYCYGQDFGFSNDPTTLVKVAVDETKKIIYVHECFYNNKQLTTSDIYELNKAHISNINDLIVADSAEPRLIYEVAAKGLNIQKTSKGAGSVLYGIEKIKQYQIIITDRSKNLERELSNYVWNDKKAGIPIDKENHCFIGETLITTNKGQKQIKDIVLNDLVLTSNGYQKVLKIFNNGVKKVYKYSMQFDTFSLSLCSTKDHKIKTTKGWKKISELQKTDVLYLCRSLMEKNINCTQGKDILVGAQKDYIQKFGNIIMDQFLKVITYIMLIIIPIIMILKTLTLFMVHCIKDFLAKKDLKTILSSQKNFMQKELKQLKNGINQSRVSNGIVNTLKDLNLDLLNMAKGYVMFVIQNMKRIKQTKNFVQINVNHNLEETKGLIILERNVPYVQESLLLTNIVKHKLVDVYVEEIQDQKVYDLMVDNNHEYFANEILVHNCIDSLRYSFMRLTNFATFNPIHSDNLL